MSNAGENASLDVPDAAERRRGPLASLQGVFRACEERLNDVNESYAFEVNPEYRLKVRASIGSRTTVGMTYDARARRYRVAVKGKAMVEDDDGEAAESTETEETRGRGIWRTMKKVVIEPEEKRVEAYTQRWSYGPLSIRAIGDYDGETNEWGVRWQLQTFHKEKKKLRTAEIPLGANVRGCVRWDVSSASPEIEGKVGSQDKFSLDVDVGSYEIKVPRLELKIDI